MVEALISSPLNIKAWQVLSLINTFEAVWFNIALKNLEKQQFFLLALEIIKNNIKVEWNSKQFI